MLGFGKSFSIVTRVSFLGVAKRKCAATCTKDFLGKNPNTIMFGGKKKLNSRYLDHRFVCMLPVYSVGLQINSTCLFDV